MPVIIARSGTCVWIQAPISGKERTLEIFDGEEVIEGRDENHKRF
jgi:hypothetical protein